MRWHIRNWPYKTRLGYTIDLEMPMSRYIVSSYNSWWRHQMETFSALLAICAGNSPVPGEFPAQRPVTRSFDVFFDLRLNKRLSKQSWDWWFETPSRPLWRHCNVLEGMACDLISTASLPQSFLTRRQWDPREHIRIKLEWKWFAQSFWNAIELQLKISFPNWHFDLLKINFVFVNC